MSKKAPAFSLSRYLWVDGIDEGALSDSGRGISDASAHVIFGISHPELVSAFISSRIQTLINYPDVLCSTTRFKTKFCITNLGYLYAGVSVRIATLGRLSANWIDGQDPSAGADSGRGISDESQHYSFAINSDRKPTQAFIDNGPAFVASRLTALLGKATPVAFASLYAELSVFIAQYGRGEDPRPVPPPKQGEIPPGRLLNPRINVITAFEDTNGWYTSGQSWEVAVGRYSNKGRGNCLKLPFPNDEVRALFVPRGYSVYVTDDDSFKPGKHGDQSVVGPTRINLGKVAGKVSSMEVMKS